MLTRKQIETMEAGPEMNAAVAELMGWRAYTNDGTNILPGHRREAWARKPGRELPQSRPPGYVYRRITFAEIAELDCSGSLWWPEYSTDIAAAMEVRQVLLDKGCKISLTAFGDFRCVRLWVTGGPEWRQIVEGWDDTDEVAICRAALLWALEQEQS